MKDEITEAEKAELRRRWPDEFASVSDDELHWWVDKTVAGSSALLNIRGRAFIEEVGKALYLDRLCDWLAKRLRRMGFD